jgi:hypothetical protein
MWMFVWGEADRFPVGGDGLLEIFKVPQPCELNLQGVPKVVEASWHLRMSIGRVADRIPVYRDGLPKVVEASWHLRMSGGHEVDYFPDDGDGLIEIFKVSQHLEPSFKGVQKVVKES